jgi:hypothetical protein
MSNDAVVPEFTSLSGANWITVEHAELIVALYAEATALHENGLHQEACAARVVLDGKTGCALTAADRPSRVSVHSFHSCNVSRSAELDFLVIGRLRRLI